MDCAKKTAGQIFESSERQCRICSLGLLRFCHIALIVILIIFGALNMVTILIRMKKRRCVEIGAKTLRNNFGMKATADEMDVTTKPSFGENENG